LRQVDWWPDPVPDWKAVRQRLRDSYREGRQYARCNAPDGHHRVDGKTNHELQRLIDKRRRKLRKRALRAGLSLYAEKPAQFEARLRGYLREWQ
jgi:hypothetical protein